MAIPDFQTLMRPLLEAYASGDERPISDVRRELGEQFNLTEEELTERLPSGPAKLFDNRVGWATTHLFHAKLLARPKRGVYVITDRGRDVLVANPDRVDLRVLSLFPETAELRRPQGGGRRRRAAEVITDVDETATPQERIDAAYQELRNALVADVLERVHTMAPSAFEDLVLDVLHAMDYGDGTPDSRLRLGGVGDAGIDGVIWQDRLGVDAVYVQAKRWGAGVGRPVVQGFVGALQGARASKGIIFTASTFTADAREYASTVTPRVILIDGERLAELMIDYNVGVAPRETYEVKGVDRDYFGDDA